MGSPKVRLLVRLFGIHQGGFFLLCIIYGNHSVQPEGPDI